MTYGKREAKAYARQHLRGVWAATLTPFKADLSVDEEGFRRNMRHWLIDLELGGLFINGKQGEFYAMTLEERKRQFQIGAEECKRAGRGATIMSCSDQNMETVIDLAKHAQKVGADFIVVHTPLLYFGAHSDETIYEYYRTIAEQVDIGVALWNQPPDCGYTLSPELCVKMAREIPNIVAIKYSVPRETYVRLSKMAGNDLIVSCSSEEEWYDNIVELGWQVYLCSSPPYLMQTAVDKRMNEYTELAMKGEIERAKRVRDSLNPVRDALKHSRAHGKPQASQKYWQDLLGQAGGYVRPPLLQLTEAEKAKIREAFAGCGLKLPAQRAA